MSAVSKIFFSSDSHFGHPRIIQYSKRPFFSVDEMDRTLIDNWNMIVGKGDRIFHLGDVSYYKSGRTIEILSELNGQKFIVRGNHDRWLDKVSEKELRGAGVVNVSDYRELKVDLDGERRKFVLFHYPIAEWNACHHGSFQLHGHSHGNFGQSYPNSVARRQADVGVDVWSYRPVPLEKVYDELKSALYTKHHDKSF